MSSSAHLTFAPGTTGVSHEAWAAFCERNNIVFSPHTMGGRTWYLAGFGAVEITYYDQHHIDFGTFWMGKFVPHVAEIALLAWREFGGSMTACPEVLEHYFTTPTDEHTEEAYRAGWVEGRRGGLALAALVALAALGGSLVVWAVAG